MRSVVLRIVAPDLTYASTDIVPATAVAESLPESRYELRPLKAYAMPNAPAVAFAPELRPTVAWCCAEFMIVVPKCQTFASATPYSGRFKWSKVRRKTCLPSLEGYVGETVCDCSQSHGQSLGD